MYQIGLFSKINRITTKTLRHYDEIDLLKPEFVDDFTGYRYYSSSQLPKLHKIITLKQMGLSLIDIKDIIDNTDCTENYLTEKVSALEKKIKEEQLKLLQVKNFMKRMCKDMKTNYSPIIKSLPEVIVASMRTIVPNYDTYFDIVPKMGEKMMKHGAIVSSPAYCFTIYHDGEFKESNIDVEICEAVIDYCDDSDNISYKKINQVENAVCVLHKGPYSTIREAYIFIFQWINDNGYTSIGMPRESYIDGIWNKEDESDWLTELQVPINK